MTSARVVPITYVNSTAAIKAITARAGGACCTSSNVANVFAWAFRPAEAGGAGAEKILAIPDEHLGRNTAAAMGYSPDDCVTYDPALPNGGLSQKSLAPAKFILWKGQCYVHQRFTAEQVRLARQAQPGITVIVHPECRPEVVKLADASGSTEQIIRTVAGGQPQGRWAVGTESNLVNRLAKQHPEQFIRVLSDGASHCAQMARIDLPHLLWVLDGLCEGHVVNRISVPDEIAAEARIALRRMIEIKAAADVTRQR
jgi:quinolinate synthase